MTIHGFEKLGLERIYGSQVAALERWQNLILLLGYRVEGYERRAFRKGTVVHDVVRNACILEDYLALKECRGGHLWPGRDKMLALMRGLPQYSIVNRVGASLAEEFV